jgi:hypothetical protein
MLRTSACCHASGREEKRMRGGDEAWWTLGMTWQRGEVGAERDTRQVVAVQLTDTNKIMVFNKST